MNNVPPTKKKATIAITNISDNFEELPFPCLPAQDIIPGRFKSSAPLWSWSIGWSPKTFSDSLSSTSSSSWASLRPTTSSSKPTTVNLIDWFHQRHILPRRSMPGQSKSQWSVRPVHASQRALRELFQGRPSSILIMDNLQCRCLTCHWATSSSSTGCFLTVGPRFISLARWPPFTSPSQSVNAIKTSGSMVETFWPGSF